MKRIDYVNQLVSLAEEIAVDVIKEYLDEHKSLVLSEGGQLSFYPDYKMVSIKYQEGNDCNYLLLTTAIKEDTVPAERVFEIEDTAMVPITDLKFIVDDISKEMEVE